MNPPFQDKNFDQVHRIGKTYTDKKHWKKKSDPSSQNLNFGNLPMFL